MLLSSEGNESIIADPNIHTEYDKKNYVLAHNYLSGTWTQPVKDESGAVIGSKILYYSKGEAGGAIPTWVQNREGPKLALNAIVGQRKWAQDKQN